MPPADEHRPPLPTDLEVATELGQRLVAAGLGRVRRVVMIGSRARGDPRPDSDLDLVVLIEIPLADRRWGATEFLAERMRLQREVGAPPIPTDLSVRTTDRFEEARRVIGGVEHLVDLEGINVFHERMKRAPFARCSADQVRRELTYGWVRHAGETLSKAVWVEKRDAARDARPLVLTLDNRAAHNAILRGLNSLLVWHQILGFKADGAAGLLAKLQTVDERMAGSLYTTMQTGIMSLSVAHSVLQIVREFLIEDPGMRPLLLK